MQTAEALIRFLVPHRRANGGMGADAEERSGVRVNEQILALFRFLRSGVAVRECRI